MTKCSPETKEKHITCASPSEIENKLKYIGVSYIQMFQKINLENRKSKPVFEVLEQGEQIFLDANKCHNSLIFLQRNEVKTFDSLLIKLGWDHLKYTFYNPI